MLRTKRKHSFDEFAKVAKPLSKEEMKTYVGGVMAQYNPNFIPAMKVMDDPVPDNSCGSGGRGSRDITYIDPTYGSYHSDRTIVYGDPYMGGSIDGNTSYIKINGGYLISYKYEDDQSLTMYKPDGRGEEIIFTDVICDGDKMGDTSYQLGGIHVGPDPWENFTIGKMIHEYGHHLQEEDMKGKYGLIEGEVKYVIKAGISSLNARYGYGQEHYYEQPNEHDASERGQKYVDEYYPNSGYKADGLK